MLSSLITSYVRLRFSHTAVQSAIIQSQMYPLASYVVLTLQCFLTIPSLLSWATRLAATHFQPQLPTRKQRLVQIPQGRMFSHKHTLNITGGTAL